MSKTASILVGTLVLFASAGLVAWFVWRTLKKSEDPGRLFSKWVITGIIFGMLLYVGGTSKSGGMESAFILPIAGAVFGVILGILWAPQLGALLASPFTSFYDGGDTEVEARPFYSIARAKEKQGRYPQAIEEIRKQLERFPEDYEGWMFLAEIYGDKLKENSSAQACVEEILRHKNHAPKNVSFALNRAADWQLALASDRAGAQACLQKIVDLLPNSEFAHLATQRLAHLTTDRMLAEKKDRPKIAMVRHEERIGLAGQVAHPEPKLEEPAAAAARLLQHLDTFPLDADAREELAAIYAHHYHRSDLASDQLEQLIGSAGASPKQIARWINLMADYHLELGPDRVAAERALRRLSEIFPGSAAAANAEKRIAYMENELRKSKTSQAIKLGSYDQNIGLNSAIPKNPTSD